MVICNDIMAYIFGNYILPLLLSLLKCIVFEGIKLVEPFLPYGPL